MPSLLGHRRQFAGDLTGLAPLEVGQQVLVGREHHPTGVPSTRARVTRGWRATGHTVARAPAIPSEAAAWPS